MFLQHQPKVLTYLFLTEMWERFGFYVVQGMLVLYLTQAFGYSDDKSFGILGIFTALAYITPVLGGFIADQFLGFKPTIFLGGIFLCFGYALLAQPWSPNFFYEALATIIVGNGLFKPNISSLLGTFYKINDPSRDSGFTIFYVGINIGVLLAGLSSGFIKHYFGWHVGFALASLGLIFGLIIFTKGLHPFSHLANATTQMWASDKAPIVRHQREKLRCFPWRIAPYTVIHGTVIIGCLVIIGLCRFLLQRPGFSAWLLPVVGTALGVFLTANALRQDPKSRKPLFALNLLIISSVVFWMIFLQMFFSVNLYIDRIINKNALGMTIPTTVFYTLESLFIIVLGPLFAWFLQKRTPRTPRFLPISKFSIALFLLGLGFTALAISTQYANAKQLVNPLWIVLAYFLLTLGETLLSPVGLSAVTQLAPPRAVGFMMGVWFVAMGFGGQFAGLIAKFSAVPVSSTHTEQLKIYAYAFRNYALLAFSASFILFILQTVTHLPRRTKAN